MKRISLIGAILTLVACGSGGDNGVTSSNAGYLSLDFVAAQDFNPNADHGQVTKYKLTLTGSEIETPIEAYYPTDTKEVTFEGFPGGSTVRVMLEAINVNNLTVRRGRSNDILIKGGQNVGATVIVNNVPIFSNVRDGATVYNNRFVPKVFALGAITFQISDYFGDRNSVIVDQITGQSHFSISESSELSIISVQAPKLDEGVHELVVKDIETGESSAITVTVLDGSNQKGLPTTAGSYMGTLMSSSGSPATNMALYHSLQTDF